MSKYEYTDFEKQINSVLKHQSEELSNIKFPSSDSLDESIASSEAMLTRLGYSINKQCCPTVESVTPVRKVLVVPTWEELCTEAEKHVGTGCDLESIFTEEELQSNEEAIRLLRSEYSSVHRLDRFDVGISALAGIVGALINILLVGIPQKGPDGLTGGSLSNYIRSYFDKKFPADEMQKLANSKESKVSFDAQDNRNTTEYVEGMSAYYHRLLSLGHDPILGFVVGVFDILTGRMTTIDKGGKIVSQIMENYADRKESDIFSALAKQVIHFKSDITTSMGLPAPLMGLFNLLQLGSIGEEEQTIAEIVQGMYYEGFDFIHFCSQSIPVMITEVIVRLGYAIKRIKEGNRIQDSIPLSLDREKHPKLGTMLFIAHAGATAANTGMIYFTKNPMAINYPQWIAFAKYSYSQLKWAVINKPEAQNAYVMGRIDEELRDVIGSSNALFDDFSKEFIVVFK